MGIIAEKIKNGNIHISKELSNSLTVSIRKKTIPGEVSKSVSRDCKGQVLFSPPRFVPSLTSSSKYLDGGSLLDYRITSGKSNTDNTSPLFLKTGGDLIGGYKKIESVGSSPEYFKGNRFVEFSTTVEKKTTLCRTSLLYYPWQDDTRVIERTIYTIPRLRNPEAFKAGKRNPTKKTKQNLIRARKRCRNLVLTNFNNNAEMWTLTYAENEKILKKAKKDLNLFFKHVNYRRKKKGLENLKYVWVAERQERGAIHFHIMVFNPELEDTTHLTKFEEERRGSEMLSHWWKFGFCFQTKRIKNKLYLCKYITKSDDFLDDVNERIFSASLGLPSTKPCVFPGLVFNSKDEVLYSKENFYNAYTMFLQKRKIRKC